MSSSPIDPAPWTFFGAPSLGDLDALGAQVALLGVPCDGGATARVVTHLLSEVFDQRC
jgi:hypothetical protein